MEKIKWCLKVKNGIELVEPNDNLSRIYTKKADAALSATIMLKNNKEWEISSCYYSMYFALYAILIRIGIKCENHSCTIEFMKEFLRRYFTEEDFKLLKDSLRARIDAQYYADREVSESQYRKMIDNAPNFIIKCKEAMFQIKEAEIADIRDTLDQMNSQDA